MPNLKDKLIVPVEVPMWAAISLLGSAIYTAGTMNQKMDVLVEQGREVKVMKEQQIANTEAIKRLSQDVNRLESRVARLEQGTPLRHKGD